MEEVPSVKEDLDLAYRGLAADEQAMYRVAGLHPGPTFGPEVAAAGLETDQAEAVRRLDGLVEAGLLTRNPDGDYRITPETHGHAVEVASKLDAEGNELAFNRIAVWYLDVARHANSLIMPRRRKLDWDLVVGELPPEIQDRPSALTWAERYRGTLVAAVQQTFELWWLSLAYQLADSCLPSMMIHGNTSDMVAVCEIGHEAAKEMGDDDAQMSAVKHLTRLYVQQGMGGFRKADEHLAIMVQLAAGDPWRESNVLHCLGYTRSRRAIEAIKHVGPLAGHAPFLWQEAVGLLQIALDMVRALDRPRSEALILVDLGEVLVDFGAAPKAIEALTQAADLFENLGEDSHNVARAQHQLGRAYNKAGRTVLARDNLEHALLAFQEEAAVRYVAIVEQALAELPQ